MGHYSQRVVTATVLLPLPALCQYCNNARCDDPILVTVPTPNRTICMYITLPRSGRIHERLRLMTKSMATPSWDETMNGANSIHAADRVNKKLQAEKQVRGAPQDAKLSRGSQKTTDAFHSASHESLVL